MVITTEQTEKVLNGKHTFSQLGFSLLLTRLKSIYSKDSSKDTLAKCTEEINIFLGRYKLIMEKDFALIAKL